uniref:PDZ domain-containing protein n=1 Tax=Plectus sambesii TaxID=2011161 RepID=A0A914V4F3_9BILA
MSAVERMEREPGVQKLILVKGLKGLGFSIAGGIGNEHVPGDVGIYVTKIIDGGAADVDGRLRVGDKLLAVDHTSLEAVTHEDAVNTLKATSTQVALLYIKNPHPELLNQSQDSSLHQTSNQQPPFSYTQPPLTPVNQGPYTPSRVTAPTPSYQQPINDPVPRSARQVTLHKGPQGLGFNIVGGEDGEPVYISYVLPGGAADLSGSVFKGDALLQVNNVNLRGATHNDAAQALKNANGNVNLVLKH